MVSQGCVVIYLRRAQPTMSSSSDFQKSSTENHLGLFGIFLAPWGQFVPRRSLDGSEEYSDKTVPIFYSIFHPIYKLLTNIWPPEGDATIWVLPYKTLAMANAVDIARANLRSCCCWEVTSKSLWISLVIHMDYHKSSSNGFLTCSLMLF